MNVVMTSRGQFIEVQASGEESTLFAQGISELIALATKVSKSSVRFKKRPWDKAGRGTRRGIRNYCGEEILV